MTLLRKVSKYGSYFNYLARHKWWVLVYCVQYGMPIRGLIHDWSKFMPDELIPYANFFESDERSQDTKDAFRLAWLKHVHRNPHHHQYWVSIADDGKMRAQLMPVHIRKEMIADWKSANRCSKYSTGDLREWWLARRERIVMHVDTREWIDKELGVG